MAHFWHDLGKAFRLKAVMMVLGDKLRAASIAEVVFSFDKVCKHFELVNLYRYLIVKGDYDEKRYEFNSRDINKIRRA